MSIDSFFIRKGTISSKKDTVGVPSVHVSYQPQVLLQRQQEYQQNLQEEERNDHLEERIMNELETRSQDSNGDDDDVLSDEGEREERKERIGLILKEERRIDKIFRSVQDPKNLTLDELGRVLKEGVLAESSQKSFEVYTIRRT